MAEGERLDWSFPVVDRPSRGMNIVQPLRDLNLYNLKCYYKPHSCCTSQCCCSTSSSSASATTESRPSGACILKCSPFCFPSYSTYPIFNSVLRSQVPVRQGKLLRHHSRPVPAHLLRRQADPKGQDLRADRRNRQWQIYASEYDGR